jgi:hypothetical protein
MMSDSAVPYDFFFCKKCHRLITALQMAKTMGKDPERRSPCACGGLKMSPGNMAWYHWLLPRVWVFAVARLRGKA